MSYSAVPANRHNAYVTHCSVSVGVNAIYITSLYFEQQLYLSPHRPPPTLWERIQSYKSGYVEKTVLLNSEVADQIVQSIVTHTRGNKGTSFLDGEGGLCQIGAKLKQLDIFGSVRVLEKDMELRSLHQFARERYLDDDVRIMDLNLNRIVSDTLDRKLYESPLLDHIPSTGRGLK